MKKIIALFLVISLFGIVLCGCNEKSLKDIQGTYYAYYPFDPFSIFNNLDDNASEKIELDIKVENNSNITYSIGEHKGTGVLSDQKLTLTEDHGDSNIEYLYKGDYIVRCDTMHRIENIEGKIPVKKWENCFITVDYEIYDFIIEFYDDGDFELEVDTDGVFCYLEGRYEVEDNGLICIKIEYGEFENAFTPFNKKNGLCNVSLYLDDISIYSIVYRKN